MDIDSTTYQELSIFHQEGSEAVFEKLSFTRTVEGRDHLRRLFQSPYGHLNGIRDTQAILRLIGSKLDQWPESISNGTLMVISRFFETPVDPLPAGNGLLAAIPYKLLHGPDYGLIRYSLSHFADFFRGMQQIIALLREAGEIPQILKPYLDRAEGLLDRPMARSLAAKSGGNVFSGPEVIAYGRFLRHEFRNATNSLIEIFGRLDAWYSMAMAMRVYGLHLPEFVESERPGLEVKGLYHLLLHNPVPYDVRMDEDSHFIFLTGANMAGKSTFIKAVGCAVFLAHLGMGVPAVAMQLTLFDGLLSNIHVIDNVARGESYFFNEVQRIRNTIQKINDGRKWLVLIDELFKGTNVQDAMRCSSAVIKGLTKIKNSLFILSTHLYEIGEELRGFPNIAFKYFETEVKDDQLRFSYQLRDGISSDRIGYLILRREGVIDMLEKL